MSRLSALVATTLTATVWSCGGATTSAPGETGSGDPLPPISSSFGVHALAELSPVELVAELDRRTPGLAEPDSWNGLAGPGAERALVALRERELLRAALARPADAERAAELAELYARGDVGELHRAAAFALRALRVDPANARAWKAFGAARLSAGAFGEARAALERAAALASRDAGAQRLLGDALVALGEREGAERAYRAALRADESDGAARYELACLLEERGDLEGARAELERAIATGSGHPSPFYRLARVLDALGDADGAEEMRRLHERATILDDRRLLEIGVSELERRLTLGAWYLDHGRPGDARPEYEAALELAKTDAEAVPALIGLTDLCTRVGELELARERLDALRRADAADPRIPLLEQRLDAARASATGGAAIGADEGEL